MKEKERFRDIIAFNIANLFGATFKARLMDKLPLYKEAFFCRGVYCYISSMVELRRSEREYRPEVYAWLERFKPGEVFYDVGANIGMFSLTVAKIHNQTVKTYAFEPSFSTFGSLVRNIVANRFGETIYPFCIALGNTRGTRVFNYTDFSPGASVHTLDTLINQIGNTFTPAFSQRMVCYKLDDLVGQFGFEPPNHVKIDVDGGEHEIIEGMQGMLQGSGIRSVMVEVTENRKDDPSIKQIISNFEIAGFKEELRIPHPGYKNYPLVFEILFTKDWNFSHG